MSKEYGTEVGIVAQTYDARLWEVEARGSKFKGSLRYLKQVKKKIEIKKVYLACLNFPACTGPLIIY